MKISKIIILFFSLSSFSCLWVAGEDSEGGETGVLKNEGLVSGFRVNPNAKKRWRLSYQKMKLPKPEDPIDTMTTEVPPPKPPRGIPRDYDDVIDFPGYENDLEVELDEDDDIKCLVEARRPYSVSPKITLTGINDRFSSILVGYDKHTEEKRSNKGSVYGWSSPISPSENGQARFTFDVDYVSILPQGGTPLSYCALIFVPPVVPKFDTKKVFGKPAMSQERYVASEEHLVKAIKRKSRKVSSCCFVAYPMVSRR